MKKYFFILILICSFDIYSQDIEIHQAIKTSQTGGRHEIVQSEISSVFTFRLDKHTGKVYLYMKLPELEQPTWLELTRSNMENDTVIPDKINYQLFLGGKSLLDCFLLNINSGTTWNLVKNSNNKFSFEGFNTSLD